MSIPTRYPTSGDKQKAESLKGFGRRLLDELRSDMARPPGKQVGKKRHNFPKGVVVECEVNHGLSWVRIHVPVRGGVEKIEQKECYCFPHFSFGQITRVQPTLPVKNENPSTGIPFEETDEEFAARVAEYQEFLLNGRFLYDVDVCARDTFLLYEGAHDANFGRYYNGQWVLVTIGLPMDSWTSPLDCQRECLCQKPRFDNLMISPIHIKDKMTPWLYLERDQ